MLKLNEETTLKTRDKQHQQQQNNASADGSPKAETTTTTAGAAGAAAAVSPNQQVSRLYLGQKCEQSECLFAAGGRKCVTPRRCPLRPRALPPAQLYEKINKQNEIDQKKKYMIYAARRPNRLRDCKSINVDECGGGKRELVRVADWCRQLFSVMRNNCFAGEAYIAGVIPCS